MRLSTWLDPHRVESYTVAAFWLRTRLGRPELAAQLLHEGWRANPDSYEILLALGRIDEANRHEPVRAHNLYALALRKWHQQEDGKAEPDLYTYREILGHLVLVDETQGDSAEAIQYLTLLKKISPNPDAIQRQIDEARAKLAPAPGPASGRP